MKTHKIKSIPSGAGIIVTYKCSAACLHCCYSSSPNRDGTYMSAQTSDKIFAQLHRLGCASVHIGGGEPFMNFEKLLDVCKSAKRNEVSIDYIETNSSWVTDDGATEHKLQELKAAGVDCLLISVDPFHNEFIPYAKVKKLEKLCDKADMDKFIWQRQFERLAEKLDHDKPHTLEEYDKAYKTDITALTAQAYGLNYNGRALRIAEQLKSKKIYSEFLSPADCGCIQSLHHCHIDFNCDLIPPSCNGFKMNLFEAAGEGLDEEKYRNFYLILNNGLSGLLGYAEKLGFVPDSRGYTTKCALCFDIKKHLCKHSESYDIGPKDFYTES